MNSLVRSAHVNLLAYLDDDTPVDYAPVRALELTLAPEPPAGAAPGESPEASTDPATESTGRRRRMPPRPHWLPYAQTAERRPSAYLSFKDAGHLTSYLRARAELAATVR